MRIVLKRLNPIRLKKQLTNSNINNLKNKKMSKSKLKDPNKVTIELNIANDITVAQGLREFADMIDNASDHELNKLTFNLDSDCTEAAVKQTAVKQIAN